MFCACTLHTHVRSILDQIITVVTYVYNINQETVKKCLNQTFVLESNDDVLEVSPFVSHILHFSLTLNLYFGKLLIQ